MLAQMCQLCIISNDWWINPSYQKLQNENLCIVNNLLWSYLELRQIWISVQLYSFFLNIWLIKYNKNIFPDNFSNLKQFQIKKFIFFPDNFSSLKQFSLCSLYGSLDRVLTLEISSNPLMELSYSNIKDLKWLFPSPYIGIS